MRAAPPECPRTVFGPVRTEHVILHTALIEKVGCYVCSLFGHLGLSTCVQVTENQQKWQTFSKLFTKLWQRCVVIHSTGDRGDGWSSTIGNSRLRLVR
jgi:hypothetical protein